MVVNNATTWEGGGADLSLRQDFYLIYAYILGILITSQIVYTNTSFIKTAAYQYFYKCASSKQRKYCLSFEMVWSSAKPKSHASSVFA